MSGLRLFGLAVGPLLALAGALLAFFVPTGDQLSALPAAIAGIVFLLLGLAAFGLGLEASRRAR